jgi:hypothetical protein
MAAAPRLTANRALHLLFAHLHRSQRGATRIVFINDGARTRLMPLDRDGITVTGLAPLVHKRIWDDVIDAAHTAARAVYGPRSNWPAHIVFEAPSTPLTHADAAPHLGDHVLNDRVYTFSPDAARAAHDVMKAIPLVSRGDKGPYQRALDTLRRLLNLPESTPRSQVRQLAMSYTRRHPATD